MNSQDSNDAGKAGAFGSGRKDHKVPHAGGNMYTGQSKDSLARETAALMKETAGGLGGGFGGYGFGSQSQQEEMTERILKPSGSKERLLQQHQQSALRDGGSLGSVTNNVMQDNTDLFNLKPGKGPLGAGVSNSKGANGKEVVNKHASADSS